MSSTFLIGDQRFRRATRDDGSFADQKTSGAFSRPVFCHARGRDHPLDLVADCTILRMELRHLDHVPAHGRAALTYKALAPGGRGWGEGEGEGEGCRDCEIRITVVLSTPPRSLA